MAIWVRKSLSSVLTLLLTIFLVSVGRAQNGAGPIAGVVTDGVNPIANARVQIQGTSLEARTDARGRFRIENVPSEAGTLQVTIIGYRPLSQSMRPGSTNLQLVMTQAAINLDAIVVTGTAGGTQSRAIGNVVSTVDASKVLATMPLPNVEQLLSARTPGVVVLPAAGQVGTGAALRVRGTSSMSLSNEPIIFIDGIRMESDPRQGPTQRGGARISRLNDINPEDIQSIEIIKGPSAATLYGTEASNGVVQIITKRGAIGRPQFDLTVRRGTDWIQNPEGRTPLRWWRDASGNLQSVNIYNYEIERSGTPIFTNGALEGYSGNLSGGNEGMRYFASASYDHDVGIVPWNWDKRLSTRLNLDLTLTPTLTARLGTGYIQRNTRLAQSNFDSDPFSNLIWSDGRTLTTGRQGWFQAPRSEWSEFEAMAKNDRILGNVELKFSPFKWFTHRLATGVDINDGVNTQLWPRQPDFATHSWGANALGRTDVTRSDNRVFTLDYGASAKFTPFTPLALTTSVGFQYYKRQQTWIIADSREFPAIPLTAVSVGVTKTSGDTLIENATVGLFVQQQIDWKNRVFLTGAVRGDDNSAFGAQYDAAIYPKLSGTWVLNDEPFWSIGWVNQLKLRAAWGSAGQQPGTFDASRLYGGQVGFNDQPTLIPGQYGNPALKPERSEELEYGFDASMLGGRIGLNVTRYHRWIKDAIVNRRVPPSSGFPGSQTINIGSVRGWGNEIGLDVDVLAKSKLGWNVGIQVATMGTRITSMGGLGIVPAGLRFEHREGYPVGGIFVRKIRSAQINSTGVVTQAICDGGTGAFGADQGGPDVDCSLPGGATDGPRVFIGPSSPTWQLGFTNAFTLFQRFRIEARIEGNGGHYNINTEMRASHNNGTTKQVLTRDDPILQATRAIENDAMGLYDASFVKLREVSVSYTLPNGWLRQFRLSRGTFTVAARNLMMLWTGHYGFNTPRDGRVRQIDELGDEWTWDPEIRSNGQIAGDFQTVLPPTTTVTATLRLGL